jgi:prepilin-type N-terminal cleavage/methylation domain-containing protein
MNKGFTLIELLVVIMIIGILSAIALPQYQAAVEKSRMSEGLITMKALVNAIQRYEQADPNATTVTRSNIADVDLKGGTWTSETQYKTKLFIYDISEGPLGTVVAYRTDSGNTSSYSYKLTQAIDNSKGCELGSEATEDTSSLCSFFTGI